MGNKHYKNELSAYVNGELGETERQTVAGHLAACDACSREHDAIKFGASLAANLQQADVPDSIWREIEEKLDGEPIRQIGLMPQTSFFSMRKGLAFAVALIAVSILSAVVFVKLFDGDSTYRAQRNTSQTNAVSPANAEIIPVGESNIRTSTNNNTNSNQATQPTGESWQVETIAGIPKVGDGSNASSIAVGQQIETDSRSKAKITVADIGTVEIGQNSLVKFVGTGKDEHRLALERGRLHAKIFAPPRLFVVDTPSGKAVDLGCEYTLEVDKRGDSLLHVTGGFVALERPGRESIVPAGMMCRMKKGGGVGTPFSTEASASFRRALERFDFSNGGSTSVQALVKEADFYDMFTLWHLLSRVSKDDRGAIFDALAKYVAPPAGVTRDGVIALEKKMIDLWRAEVETVWFS